MYNIKKIYRKKSNFFIIIIFSLLFLCLLFLFKYLFVVQKDVEVEIYDKHKNRELIVYESKESVAIKSQNINDILYIYPDYQILFVENDLGVFTINSFLPNDMPNIINGKYPTASNEILLPKHSFVNGKKLDLTKYLNKEITFVLNGEKEITFYVTGIYEEAYDVAIYYNLKYIEQLLAYTSNNITEYTRVLLNHHKNINKVLDKLGMEGALYNISGQDEINVYDYLLDLVLLFIIIIIIFIIIILFVVSSIMYNDTLEERFIKYALGYNKHMITINYINYYFKIFIISFIIAFIGFLISTILYNNLILTDNLVLNDLFKLSLNLSYLLPIGIVLIFIMTLLYLIIRFRLGKRYY